MLICGLEILLVLVLSVITVSHPHRQLSPPNTLSPSLVDLEVVAILPTPSKRALGLSRTLFRTLNSITAADLVSQLDFPEKNLTWTVRNFFVSGLSISHSQSLGKKERLVQHRNGHPSSSDDDDEEIDPEEFDEDGDEDEYEEEENPLLGDDGTAVPVRFGRKGRHKVPFGPQSIEKLCDFLSSGKVLAIISLLPDYGHRLLSLISGVANLPLVAHSSLTTLTDEDELLINLSTTARDMARALVQLLVHCHWHSFTVLFDDSPRIRATQWVWEQELTTKVKLRSSSNESSDFYPDMDYPHEEEEEWELRPTIRTIQTRFSNSAFRALSEITKATQGVVLLILSQRSTMAVFQAAKQLRMLNGDYIFIMVDPRSQFEGIPSWVPHGVLALESPRLPWMDKKKMRYTGTLLATAVTSLKDQPFPLRKSGGGGRGRSRQVVGGVFSGFTNRDFEIEGELDFVGEEEQETKAQEDTPTFLDVLEKLPNLSCYEKGNPQRRLISTSLTREIRKQMLQPETSEEEPQVLSYEVLNLMRPPTSSGSQQVATQWTKVGTVSLPSGLVTLNTIRWPGGGIFGPGDNERPSKSYRVVTVVSPPFVMESQPENNKTCVRGLPCLKVQSLKKDDLAVAFAEFESRRGTGTGDYELACCDGLAMDLLASVARELKFEIDLFLVPDGYYGSKNILSIRATAVDFSTPFFFSGVGLLGISKERDVPLLAFLAPFSPTLWAAIFITLNLTALVVAIYEWFSPFGLNPWGRQRTKNFSISSALWVVWGRLFSHLVAFKAPKSWPNKFLINVWGGFSVIFVASYTANIAALFAGMFFERHVDVNDRSLLSQRVTAIKHSASDFYIKRENPMLWEHIQRFPVHSFQEGVQMLKNGSVDLLIGDGPLLDYYRGTDSSCNLIDVSDHDKIGDDSYAVAMTRGFPLKDSVSGLISKYLGNGYLDYLQGKWYGQMPCFSKNQQAGARALGVDAVVGMLIMLAIAVGLGIVILILELVIFKRALPYWRSQPKGTMWRSPNVMFFSQKLYRFINCVELVSPHHAAKELAKTLRQGQITSLFQKSVKRKEHEQRRRRKSKAQFYEMIQEIKRVQMAEKHGSGKSGGTSSLTRGGDDESGSSAVYSIQGRMDKDIYLPPRLARVPGGEEILIADYPTGERIGPQGAPSSLDDPPSTSASDTANTQRRIQWRHPRPGLPYSHFQPPQQPTSSSFVQPRVPYPHGILRRGGRLEVAPAQDEGGQQQSANEGEDLEETDDEEGEVSDDDHDSYELYSPLDKADLKTLSKNQIIEMWRASELDLRRQLSQALKAKDELSVALSRTETPALLVEFDQVKL